jgi:uncharacterized phage protein gp47/JayE
MPANLTDLQTPVTKESVRAVILDMLSCLNFPVDSWQDEGAARSFVETQAHLLAVQSQSVAQIALMVFLQTATGSFLDALVQSHFDLTRNAAVASVFDVSFVNSGAVTHSVTPGSALLRATNGQIFQSDETINVPAHSTTQVQVRAQVAGAAGNVPAQELELVTPLAGVVADYDGAQITSGADLESDTKLRERAAAKWGALRVEKVDLGLVSLAREAAPSVHGVSIDSDNPRGPGTVDVYLSSETGTVGSGDLALVQAALDAALFGTGDEEEAGLAVAAPLQVVNLAATVYVRGADAADVRSRLTTAWDDFLLDIPLGGFDLSPGPTNVVQRAQISTELIRRAYTDSSSPIVSLDVTSPSSDLTIGLHTKAVKGTVSFTVVALS